jgi:hypothetical protein
LRVYEHLGCRRVGFVQLKGDALVVGEHETQFEGPCAALASASVVDAVAGPFAILRMDQIEEAGTDEVGWIDAIRAHSLADEDDAALRVDTVDDIGHRIDDGLQCLLEGVGAGIDLQLRLEIV